MSSVARCDVVVSLGSNVAFHHETITVWIGLQGFCLCFVVWLSWGYCDWCVCVPQLISWSSCLTFTSAQIASTWESVLRRRCSNSTLTCLLGSVASLCDFRINLPIVKKYCEDFDKNYTESVEQVEKNWHLENIVFLSIGTGVLASLVATWHTN